MPRLADVAVGRVAVWWTVVLAPLLSGCGSQVATAPVEGRVEFDGQPLVGGGRVLFVPIADSDDQPSRKAAIGIIAEDGTFQLGTYGQDDGAVLGEHRIEIRQNTVLTPAVYAAEAGPTGESVLLEPLVEIDAADRIPTIYAGEDSPLRMTVENGSNEFPIDLKRSP